MPRKVSLQNTGEQPSGRDNDARVVAYWTEIASAWTQTIRSGAIRSRELATNAAIVKAILDRRPASVLDVGCGEGWLCRALEKMGIRTVGIDAIPELIFQAQSAGSGDFRVVTYESLAAGTLGVKVDVVVCNYSLLGRESAEGVVRIAPSLINKGGALIVQTPHPVVVCGDEPYSDGWRTSPWTGISTFISDPSPWYFRRFETWIQLFLENGFKIVGIREPTHPETKKPASIIFLAQPTFPTSNQVK